MPTRRLVVALSVLLLGIVGVGIVTALGRSGDDGKPRAQPTQSPGFTPPPPLETTDPSAEPTVEPTVEPTPTVAPTTPPPAGTDGDPDGDTDGDGDVDGDDTGGGGGDPNMPNTGVPLALALLATATLAAAGGVRRLAR